MSRESRRDEADAYEDSTGLRPLPGWWPHDDIDTPGGGNWGKTDPETQLREDEAAEAFADMEIDPDAS